MFRKFSAVVCVSRIKYCFMKIIVSVDWDLSLAPPVKLMPVFKCLLMTYRNGNDLSQGSTSHSSPLNCLGNKADKCNLIMWWYTRKKWRDPYVILLMWLRVALTAVVWVQDTWGMLFFQWEVQNLPDRLQKELGYGILFMGSVLELQKFFTGKGR